MKMPMLAGTALVALGVAATAALPGAAAADDTINRANDSVIQTQQMDYLTRHGGYVIYQDTYSDAVGGRNATMVQPAPRAYMYTSPAPATATIVVPGPAYGMVTVAPY